MAVTRKGTPLAAVATVIASLLGIAQGDSLKDIDHVVLFMQENRAFDHYFGTMAGVRGFNDANLQMNGNRSVWQQKVSPKSSNATDYMMPWYINYLGGDWPEASQCMYAGSNSWDANHAAFNNGSNDLWPIKQNPYSIGFYKRQDLPTQFSLAENWVVADMYQEAVMAATNPNRVFWASGSINAPGGGLDPSLGGNPYIDNNETPGCEDGINCYPLKWKTSAEYYEAAGTSWQLFQDEDNFDDNPHAWFKQYQDSKPGDPLYEKSMKGQPLRSFYDRAANGTLPEVSYIVGPMQLAEHPPYSPHDGAWLENNITETILNSPKYNRTVLIISFDETGGWFDHVNPFRSPSGTPGEWIEDPYGTGYTFIGPGLRVPFYIISPWTRHGGVFVEHADHNSQIMFIEKWQAAKGRDVKSKEVVPWRRNNMGDLLNAFDFANPDYSVPELPNAPPPHKDKDGNYDGSSHCQSLYPDNQPPIPYTGDGVIKDMASVVEKGFKPVRGKMTEGRFLTFEASGHALSSYNCHKATVSLKSDKHDALDQRWIVHAQELGGTEFTLESVKSKCFLCDDMTMCRDKNKAVVLDMTFTPGKGYNLAVKGGKQVLTVKGRNLSLDGGSGDTWSAFSVNY